MGVLAVIPARGGSKGIVKKNIKTLGGMPLIAWTIRAAQRAGCIERLIVSTDDEETADIASSWGADVPFMRPAHLATDESAGVMTALHAIESLPGHEWLMLLQPTSPLRTASDIDGIWKHCQESKAASAVSICRAPVHPSLLYHCNQHHRLTPLLKDFTPGTRRQDLPPMFSLNGALYLIHAAELRRERSLINDETIGYVMPEERSVDIDTEIDWRFAESLVSHSPLSL